MSRPRRPRQEVACCTIRVATGLALTRVSLSRQSILGRDRVLLRPEISMSRQSLALDEGFMSQQSILTSRYNIFEYICLKNVHFNKLSQNLKN